MTDIRRQYGMYCILFNSLPRCTSSLNRAYCTVAHWKCFFHSKYFCMCHHRICHSDRGIIASEMLSMLSLHAVIYILSVWPLHLSFCLCDHCICHSVCVTIASVILSMWQLHPSFCMCDRCICHSVYMRPLHLSFCLCNCPFDCVIIAFFILSGDHQISNLSFCSGDHWIWNYVLVIIAYVIMSLWSLRISYYTVQCTSVRVIIAFVLRSICPPLRVFILSAILSVLNLHLSPRIFYLHLSFCPCDYCICHYVHVIFVSFILTVLPLSFCQSEYCLGHSVNLSIASVLLSIWVLLLSFCQSEYCLGHSVNLSIA